MGCTLSRILLKTSLLDELRRLIDEAEFYRDLLTTDDEIRVEVSLTDTGERATLKIGELLEVGEESADLDLRLTMEERVFEALLDGEADFAALIGRSRMSDVRPINFEFLNSERIPEIYESMKALMTFFFTPGRVKVKRLREELAGEAHGAHPIPITYWDGLRFAWYLVKEGQTMNEEGERDDYPQAVIILKGRGIFTIGDVEIAIEPSTVIYVPKNCLHQLRADEDVEIVWLAWQTPP